MRPLVVATVLVATAMLTVPATAQQRRTDDVYTYTPRTDDVYTYTPHRPDPNNCGTPDTPRSCQGRPHQVNHHQRRGRAPDYGSVDYTPGDYGSVDYTPRGSRSAR
jgi:hypothetical protein